MSGKYNRKKTGMSHYKERLRFRGISKAPTMKSLSQLRKEQGRGKGEGDDDGLEEMLDAVK